MRRLPIAIALAISTAVLTFTADKLGAIPANLPPLQQHPVPSTLVQWQDSTNSGDYFSAVKPTEVGYLVWSDFPVKIYVEPATSLSEPNSRQGREAEPLGSRSQAEPGNELGRLCLLSPKLSEAEPLGSRSQAEPGNELGRLCLLSLKLSEAEPLGSRSQAEPGNELGRLCLLSLKLSEAEPLGSRSQAEPGNELGRLCLLSLKVNLVPLASDASKAWVEAVLQAVREWGLYLPLQVVEELESADIVVVRSRPPLQASFNRNTGQFDIERARAAEARYELYLRSSRILSHRFTINLNPNAAPASILASARHELGHALGIWGHSELETDALYFSQVRNPPLISARDINTLKRIYQQPTRLGWRLPE